MTPASRLHLMVLSCLTFLFVMNACKSAESISSDTMAAGSLQPTARSDRPAQLFRFDPWLQIMQNVFENTPNATLDSVTEALLDSQVRVASYNLQGLCRLYASEDKMFKELRDEFKGMEDAIGGYDKWDNIVDTAKKNNASADTIAKFRAKRDIIKGELKAFLIDRKWYRTDGKATRLTKIRKDLEDYKWFKYKKDRELMLTNLADELKEIKKTKYQFDHLEADAGLHELRRDLKWVAIEVRALNGLVLYDDQPDPNPLLAYVDLVNQPIAKSKYAQLQTSTTERDICKIQKYLLLGVLQMVDDLGELKDAAEVAVNNDTSNPNVSDDVPPAIRVKAEAVYGEMVKNGLIEAFYDKIKSCI